MKAFGKEETLTSVLAGDEIDPLAKLDLEITMAHEILELNPQDRTRPGTLFDEGSAGSSPGFRHGFVAFLGFLTPAETNQKEREREGNSPGGKETRLGYYTSRVC